MVISILLLLILKWLPIPLFVKSSLVVVAIILYLMVALALLRQFRRNTWFWERVAILIIYASLFVGFLNLCPYVNCSEHVVAASLVGTETNNNSTSTTMYAYSVYGTPGEGYNREEDAQWLIEKYGADFEHYAYIVSLGMDINSIRYSSWDNGNIWIPVGWKYYNADVNEGVSANNQTVYIFRIPQLAFEMQPYLSND